MHNRNRRRVLRSFPAAENIQVLGLAPGETVEEAVAKYQASGLVDFAEPDYRIHVKEVVPNDPYFEDGSQWHLRNLGQLGGVPGADIHATTGWETLHSASNVVVAIVDSGVRYTHEDLAANSWVNPKEIPGNGIDDDGNGVIDDVHGINAINNSGDPMDENGHGTHVAGIIGAVGGNGKGVSGVAWSVQIMACRFLDSAGSGDTSDAIQCIDYARRNGAKIINASWGSSDFSLALQTAIANARSAGIIIVAAAGNEADNIDLVPSYPAAYTGDNIVTVAATTRSDILDSLYSSYGAKSVDLGAPGTAIYSTWQSSDLSYHVQSGTSMAAPCVSGVLALLRARFPDDTYRQTILRLLAGTDPLPSLEGRCVSGGRVNLAKALGASFLADFTASPTFGSAPLTVNFTNTSFGAVSGFSWDFGDKSAVSTAPSPSHVYQSPGDFTVTLTVTSTNGATASKSRLIQVVANYSIISTNYDWIDPASFADVALSNNGVSQQALPFEFRFYDQPFRQIYVCANGVLGFSSANLQTTSNTDLPNSATPNNIIAPYWDDLNPATLGKVKIGTLGEAPHRRYVVSWVGVPRRTTAAVILTFQVILHENSGRIEFQYLEVHPEESRGAGRRASVGIENATGLIAAKYLVDGFPLVLSNQQSIVFLPSPRTTMSVTPSDSLDTIGPVGGPFSTPSKPYVIENEGNNPLDWSVSSSQPWLTVAPSSGTLNPGDTVSVKAALTLEADLLALGGYSAVISFVNNSDGAGNTTRSVTLAVEGTDRVLDIAPETGLDSTGLAGGPFFPDTRVYTLLNTGDATFNWTASSKEPWLSIFPVQGTIHPGESTSVTLAFNDPAAALLPGDYATTVRFVNESGGTGDATREVTLKVLPSVTVASSPTLSALPGLIRLSGQPAQPYVLETSTNLIEWNAVFTNSTVTGSWDFFIDPATLGATRFYRARTP